ncbi:MAG: hypothetical protein IT424_04260 [Pirellulales bacterium]|nr:hypothetical protein [Pirellulales bacterium]
MIQEAESLSRGNVPEPHFAAHGPERGVMMARRPLYDESTEQEINRLTWAVLDGQASLNDRQRLAELVNQQHALRRRTDR